MTKSTKTPQLSSPTVNFAMFVESAIFPFCFLAFAFNHLCELIISIPKIQILINQFEQSALNINSFLFVSHLLTRTILLFFCLLLAYSLLIRKNLKHKPDKASEILIPFIATFWALIYNIVPLLPQHINKVLLPEKIMAVSLILGTLISICGACAATWAVYNLRHSFAVFVQVRTIVTGGLYKYVRHPIYFAYILMHSGLFLVNPRALYLLFSSLLIIITIYRARLEEAKLAKHSEEYQQYMKKTPFILPIKF